MTGGKRSLSEEAGSTSSSESKKSCTAENNVIFRQVNIDQSCLKTTSCLKVMEIYGIRTLRKLKLNHLVV